MATKPPSDAPFGLEPNVAAGLAYLLWIVGGIVMLVGGGTNKFVKWAAAQSITLWATYIVVMIVLSILTVVFSFVHLGFLFSLLSLLVWVAGFIAWVYTSITGFQGKEVRLPIIADLTTRFFGSQL